MRHAAGRHYQGREISDRFLTLLENATPEQVKGTMQTRMDEEQDPRLREIANRLVTVLQTRRHSCLNRHPIMQVLTEK